MHLDKHGWGFKEMILLTGLLALFLLISVYYIYSMYNEFDKDINKNYYYELEKRLEEQARIYLNDYYDDMLTSDNVKITRNVLKVYNLDIPIEDNKGRDCSGYVIANKSKAIVNVKGYISCKNYTTEGYKE